MEDFIVKEDTQIPQVNDNTSPEEDKCFEYGETLTEAEPKKSYLLTPVNPDFPATIYFQYDTEVCKLENSAKRKTAIIWKDSIVNILPNKALSASKYTINIHLKSFFYLNFYSNILN